MTGESRINSLAFASIGFLIALIFIVFHIDAMWSASVDLAHHYALAFRISELWVLPPEHDPTLGEMNYYPNGAHVVAALLGSPWGSVVVGIQIVALGSIALVWLSSAYVIRSLPVALGGATALFAIALLALNKAAFGFELHGGELVGNFFFSQLVGDALLFFLLAALLGVERKHGPTWAAVALLPLMLLVAEIHLLPALKALGLIAGLNALSLCVDRESKRVSVREISGRAALVLVAAALLIAHPSFSAMRMISENDGALQLHGVAYPLGLLAACVLLTASSTALLVQWWRRSADVELLALKYLALLGLVTSALCVLQYVLNLFGIGSDYAVKKYSFGVLTALLLQMSVIASILFVSSDRFRKAKEILGGDAARAVLVSAFTVLALLGGLPHRKVQDVSDLVATEQKLLRLADGIPLLERQERPAVAIGLKSHPAPIDYMFSIAILKTPRELAIPDVLINRDLVRPDAYSFVVTMAQSPTYGSAGCGSLVPGDLAIVDATCIGERLVSHSACRNGLDFTAGGILQATTLSGFSWPEPEGRWTDGPVASFECWADGVAFPEATLELAPFLHGGVKAQRLEIAVNGKNIFSGTFGAGGIDRTELQLDLRGVAPAETFVFVLKLDDATSPSDIGLSEDARKLGFRLKRISFGG